MIVAIDGTVSSGKSTIARELAKYIGFLHINTGAIYRALTVKFLNNNIKPDELEKIKNAIMSTIIDMKQVDNATKIFIDGNDVTQIINTPVISQNVSHYSKIPEVRGFARFLQHQFAGANNCVIEGRDIGTVVFPNADVKIFMTADVDVRAKRRLTDYEKQGKTFTLEEVKAEILARDKEDEERPISPLKPAKDAFIYYNNGSDIKKVILDLVQIIENKIGYKI